MKSKQLTHNINTNKVTQSLLLMLGALLLFACGNEDKGAATGGGQAQAMPVEAIIAEAKPITYTKDLPGRVTAHRTAEVRARVSGIIESRLFEEGTDVTEGQSLYQIEDDTLRANVKAAEASVAEAEANYEIAKLTADRYERLYKQRAVSKQDRDTNLATAKKAEALLEQAKAALSQQEIQLKYSKVLAPISGRIGKSFVTEGALASATTSTAFAMIEQLDKVYIDFTQPYSEVISLQRQMQSNTGLESPEAVKVDILLDDGSVFPHQGDLTFSDLAVDASTGAISLRALVDNPNHTLLPGMYVRVKLPVAENANAIVLPQKAVTFTGMDTIVYKVVDGKLAIAPVKLGPAIGGDWVIESGVEAGDQVVTSYLMMAQPDMPVTVLPTGQSPDAQQASQAKE